MLASKLTTITKEMRTETAHRLTNYQGRCAHMHGHSYLWRVTVGAQGGKLDARGMVGDFKDLKEVMMEVLDPWDHGLVLHDQDPLVQRLGEDLIEVLEPTSNSRPACDRQHPRLFVYPWNPTAENMVAYVAREVQILLDHRTDDMLVVVAVECWETATSYAKWVSDRALVTCFNHVE